MRFSGPIAWLRATVNPGSNAGFMDEVTPIGPGRAGRNVAFLFEIAHFVKHYPDQHNILVYSQAVQIYIGELAGELAQSAMDQDASDIQAVASRIRSREPACSPARRRPRCHRSRMGTDPNSPDNRWLRDVMER
jgi:hypothetical protein